VVNLAAGNDVRGLQLDPQGTGGGISGGAGDASGTIDDVRIVDAGTAGTSPGLDLNGTSGTYNISNLTVDNSAATGNTSGSEGVRLNSAGTANFASAGTISVTTKGAKALDATSTSMGAGSVFDDLTTTGSGTGGVSLSSTTGTTQLGDGSGTDLNLTTTSGSTPALSIASGGTVSVPSAGTSNISATGGPAVDVTGTSGATLPLDTVDSTNSAGDGINIDGLGTGTFSATGGTITGASGISFDLNSGSGAITYPGTFGNGSGTTAFDITGRTGGVVSLSGSISDTNDAGGGVNVASNTGGATVLSGATKQFNTGASDAVDFTSSDGHTLVFSGGGSDIDTTSGKGVEATTSGTLQFSGTGNTLDTGTGRGLNVSDTDIAAAGITFQHISSSGASNGIRLNNTGSSGGLTVTGTGSVAQGGDASGGTIANSTSHAISLDTTQGLSLNDMSVTSPQHAGIKGQGVNGLSFTNGTISGAGAAQNDQNDSSLALNNTAGGVNDNVHGAVTVNNNVLSNAYGGGVDIQNYNGTISNALIQNNAVSSSSLPANSKGNAIFLRLLGSATTVANLTKATISGNTVTNFPSGNGIEVLGGNTAGSGAGVPAGTYGTFNTTPGAGTNIVSMTGNFVVGDATNKLNGSAILAEVDGKGQGNFDMSGNGSAGNKIRNMKGAAMGAGSTGSAQVSVQMNSNQIAANNQSGANGIGIGIDKNIQADASTLANPQLNIDLSSNNVSGSSGIGIWSLMHDSNGTENLRMNNNTVGGPAQPNPGMRADIGDSGSASFNPTLCSQISGNTTANGGPDGFGNTDPGLEIDKESTSAATYKFGIVGLAPSPATPTQTESYLTGLNPGSALGGGFFAGKKVAVLNGDNFTSCTLPF
jgi:hypothetical protein